MADLQKILNKFSELGIENKGLSVDVPINKPKEDTRDPVTTAQKLNEGLNGKSIPGISDVSSSDMAALAGVGKPQQRPQPANPNPNMTVSPTQTTDRWNEVDTRLSNIETKLNTIFESIQRITEISDEDYRAKRKALQDIQKDPNTSKDPDLKKELIRRKEQLEKEREETTKESVEVSLAKSFSDFLNDIERNN